MKDLIEDCIFSETMRTKWEHMLEDAKATLSAAFDDMIRNHEKISSYTEQTVGVGSVTFHVQRISIGFATFVLASNTALNNSKLVLVNAFLMDGKPVYDWHLTFEPRYWEFCDSFFIGGNTYF